jgi:hypothetical protein
MSKQQTAVLAMVPASEEPALSPARQRLAQAIADRAAADADFQDVVKQHARVEALIPNKKKILDRITQLEQVQSAEIEQWAIDGKTAEPPQLPAVAEIGHLKSELKAAEAVEPGARAAAARLIEQITACQTFSRRAIERVQSAVASVVFEEAEGKIAELEELERRAAELHGDLLARSRYLLLEEQRGRSGALSATVRQMIPRRLELAHDHVHEKVRALEDLAGRLVTNPHAQLEDN